MSAAATALRLINKRGTTITYARDSVEDEPETGNTITLGWSRDDIKALVEDYTGIALMSGQYLASDKKISIAAQALDIVPTPGDTITIGEDGYTVTGKPQSIYDGETVALYVLQCRA